jgi:hypothetical protein
MCIFAAENPHTSYTARKEAEKSAIGNKTKREG